MTAERTPKPRRRIGYQGKRKTPSSSGWPVTPVKVTPIEPVTPIDPRWRPRPRRRTWFGWIWALAAKLGLGKSRGP